MFASNPQKVMVTAKKIFLAATLAPAASALLNGFHPRARKSAGTRGTVSSKATEETNDLFGLNDTTYSGAAYQREAKLWSMDEQAASAALGYPTTWVKNKTTL